MAAASTSRPPLPTHILSAAAVVVNDRNELLLVRSPRRGWEMPGGLVERGETLQQAAIREVLEESGIEIAISGFAGVFQNVARDRCHFHFLAKPIGGSPRTGSESLEVAWFPLPAALERVTHGSFRQRIERTLDRASWPFLVVEGA